jgi:hypothetical protein
MSQQPLVGQGLLIIEASRSHSVRHTAVSRTALDEWSCRRLTACPMARPCKVVTADCTKLYSTTVCPPAAQISHLGNGSRYFGKLFQNCKWKHTHTHTHTYIYIYAHTDQQWVTMNLTTASCSSTCVYHTKFQAECLLVVHYVHQVQYLRVAHRVVGKVRACSTVRACS